MESIYFRDLGVYLTKDLEFSEELSEDDFFSVSREYGSLVNNIGLYVVVDENIKTDGNLYYLKLSDKPTKIGYNIVVDGDNQVISCYYDGLFYLSEYNGKLVLEKYKNYTHMNVELKRYDEYCIKNKSEEFENNPTKTVILIIPGFGFISEDRIREIKDFYLRNTKVDDIEIIYNPSAFNMLKRIGQLYYGYNYLRESKFVKSLYNKILDHLENNHKVLVYAHSYGGAVMSTIANLYNEDILDNVYDSSLFSNLYIATFGSILTVTHHININLVQYMYYNDVALKTNKLILPNYNDKRFENLKDGVGTIKIMYDCKQFITWIKTTLNKEKIKNTIFGTKTEWDFHNFYENLETNLMYFKTIYLNEVNMDDIMFLIFHPNITHN